MPALAGIDRPELPDFLANREAALLHVVGRLNPNVGVSVAGADLDRVIRELAAEYQTPFATAARVSLLVDELIGRTRPAIRALIGAATLLLVSAANVAGLMILQTTRRRREFAVPPARRRGDCGGGRRPGVHGAPLSKPQPPW